MWPSVDDSVPLQLKNILMAFQRLLQRASISITSFLDNLGAMERQLMLKNAYLLLKNYLNSKCSWRSRLWPLCQSTAVLQHFQLSIYSNNKIGYFHWELSNQQLPILQRQAEECCTSWQLKNTQLRLSGWVQLSAFGGVASLITQRTLFKYVVFKFGPGRIYALKGKT